MSRSQKEIYQTVGRDLRILSRLVTELIDDTDVGLFIGRSALSDLKRIETYLDTVRSKCEGRYLMKNPNGDLVEFYATHNDRLDRVIEALRKE